MATPPSSNGSHGSRDHDRDEIDRLVGRELQAFAQARVLRERPAELLASLQSFVQYDLRRRVQQGQLDHEDLQRDEVIDTAFAAALGRLAHGDPIRDLPSFLRGRAQDAIAREVRRVRAERLRHVSLEQTISGERDEGGEVVRVADIIPDLRSREPEQIVIDNETLRSLMETLADVPDLWRTIFLQRTVQERSAREVADREGLDIDEVRRITIRTREYLREHMEDDDPSNW